MKVEIIRKWKHLFKIEAWLEYIKDSACKTGRGKLESRLIKGEAKPNDSVRA